CNTLLIDCNDVLLVLLLGRGERLTLDDADVDERDPILSGDLGGIACDNGIGVIGFDFLVTIFDVVSLEMVPSVSLQTSTGESGVDRIRKVYKCPLRGAKNGKILAVSFGRPQRPLRMVVKCC
ncbi:hypothetical protein X798_02304, partial [Onchocerca flexuosa]